jgi:hypothetical protein
VFEIGEVKFGNSNGHIVDLAPEETAHIPRRFQERTLYMSIVPAQYNITTNLLGKVEYAYTLVVTARV